MYTPAVCVAGKWPTTSVVGARAAAAGADWAGAWPPAGAAAGAGCVGGLAAGAHAIMPGARAPLPMTACSRPIRRAPFEPGDLCRQRRARWRGAPLHPPRTPWHVGTVLLYRVAPFACSSVARREGEPPPGHAAVPPRPKG